MKTFRSIALAILFTLTTATATIAKDEDRTCWWYWSDIANAYIYDEDACPDGPDPGYPTDPDRIELLPDTALSR